MPKQQLLEKGDIPLSPLNPLSATRLRASSTYKIAQKLNLMGIRSRMGGKGWAPASIQSILTNATYIGKAYYNRRLSAKPEKP